MKLVKTPDCLPAPLFLFLLGNLVRHGIGRGTFPPGVGEHMNLGLPQASTKAQAFFKIRLGLSRKAHDQVGGHSAAGVGLFQHFHDWA